MTSSWPLRSHLPLGALPTAVSHARLHARQVLWVLADPAGTVELVVSELTTNALRASRGRASPAVRLWLVSDRTSIVVHVWDASSQMPQRQDAGPDSDRGRGLLLVDVLSRDWGCYPTADGKVVWATSRCAYSTECSARGRPWNGGDR